MIQLLWTALSKCVKKIASQKKSNGYCAYEKFQMDKNIFPVKLKQVSGINI